MTLFVRPNTIEWIHAMCHPVMTALRLPTGDRAEGSGLPGCLRAAPELH